jgi:integrase
MRSDLLTTETVRSAKPPETGQRLIWDGDAKHGGVTGFGLRITAAGAKTFILNYRFNDPADTARKNNQYRFAIGPAKTTARGGGWAVDEARKEADRWRKLIDRGETHPLAERKGRQEAVKAAREAQTFKAALDDYITHEQIGRKGNATALAVKNAITRNCDDWLDRPVASITPAEIGKLLRMVRDGDEKKGLKPRPYLANRLHAYLATFFRYCAKPDVAMIPASPIVGIDRPWEGEEVRDRVFSDREIKAIWRAADEIGGTGGAFCKVLLLTGKRKGALSAMRWNELDDDGLWSPPVDNGRRKRTKRLHGVPLPVLAQRILRPLRPRDGNKSASPNVFPGRVHGTHLYPGSDLSDAIKRKSGVSDFFYHALRHTLETRLAELGVLPHVRDLILDHAPVRGAGKGYDHWTYRNEMAAALDLWAERVEKIVSPSVALLR